MKENNGYLNNHDEIMNTTEKTYYEREKERILNECKKRDGTMSAEGRIKLKNLDFQEYRFSGLSWEQDTNKYILVDQYSESTDKAIIQVESSSLFTTMYGYGFRTDEYHIVWLKDWQVNQNYYGNFILVNKEYWKESVDKYDKTPSACKPGRLSTFDQVKIVAKMQARIRDYKPIHWETSGCGKWGKGGKFEGMELYRFWTI